MNMHRRIWPFQCHALRFVVAAFVALVVVALGGRATLGQMERPKQLGNGNMEAVNADGTPEAWFFRAAGQGSKISDDGEEAFEGAHAALIDTRETETEVNSFANLSQIIDATEFRGKRVRFRAAVKVDAQNPDDRAQLWFRVDMQSTGVAQNMGFFDNMSDRPIRADQWEHYEIVGDIDDNAETIVLGLLAFGKCRTWIDDVSLVVVDKSAAVTGISTLQPSDSPQPFFTWWLLLPVVAMLLFVLGYARNRWVNRFAFRFSFAYWILYCLPSPVQQLIPNNGGVIANWYSSKPVEFAVRWTASNVLGINQELVSAHNNGSGDTTYSYVSLLVCFSLAVATGLIWSLVDWRKTRQLWAKDLLRSYLRYVLAATMLGYGLAKLSVLFNQFPVPGVDRLSATYGDSSPMGLAWTFMGASRAYTLFSGAGEVLAALLLIWRRTTLLGVLVSSGVMLNIVMLNFCYDIPVKQYSVHLLVTGLFIGLPDFRRVANVLFWNRPTEPTQLAPPYAPGKWIWLQRIGKAYLVLMLIAWPCYEFVQREIASRSDAQVLGEWRVSEIVIDGQSASEQDSPLADLNYIIIRFNYGRGIGYPTTFVTHEGSRSSATTTIAGRNITISSDRGVPLLQGDFQWERTAKDLMLTGEVDGAIVELSLQPAAYDFLLMNRGFRWINERPFNR